MINKQKILVVDDEQGVRLFLRRMLEREGFAVVEAENGSSALASVRKENPAMILLDIKMPDIDGFEVCKKIREFSSVPVILLTGLSDDREKAKGLDVGADDYITKPFSSQELMARVKAVMRRNKPIT